MKKKIVHIIDNLGRGGAETMLVSLLPDLNTVYEVILVTLSDKCEFEADKIGCYQQYNIDFTGFKNIFSAVRKLKKIIAEHQPQLVRSDLFISSIIARMATPPNIPLVFAVHSLLSMDAFENSRMAKLIEKITYQKKHTIIAVSEAVLKDYDRHIGIKGKKFVLHNFVGDSFFSQPYSYQVPVEVLKIIAVGNLKTAKNYDFLLNAVNAVKEQIPLQLDIVGEGYLRAKLEEKIHENNLPVKLCGNKANVAELLTHYNLFVMCSSHEGFGNAAIEAMAVGVPLILNDTETMREMSKNNALFFSDNDTVSFKKVLSEIKEIPGKLNELSASGKAIARKFYSKEQHFSSLQTIYTTLMETANS